MVATLRPISFNLMLLAAGVLLGLLAIALLVTSATHGSHGLFMEAAKAHYVAKMRPMGVLWH